MRDHCKECVCISSYINISYSLISVWAPKNWISISLYYKHAVMSDWSETHLFLQVKHLFKNQSTQNEASDSWRSVPQCENGSRVVPAVLSVTNTRSGCGPPLLSPAASRRHSRSTSALSTADPHSQSGDLHAQTSRSLSVHPAALSRQTPTLLEAELTQHVSVVVFSDVRIHLSMTSEYSWAFCSVF